MATAFAPAAAPEVVREALLHLQLHPSEPRLLGRLIELPEGAVMPRVSLISLPPAETPGLDCFICAHLTPELMRRPGWLAHPNGATGLKGIDVLVEHTTPLLPAYDRLFGIQQVTTTDTVASIRVGRHRLAFSTPDDFVTMHPGIDLDSGFGLPAIVSLELGIERRERTANHFVEQQILFEEMPDGSLMVPANEANGAILFFSEG